MNSLRAGLVSLALLVSGCGSLTINQEAFEAAAPQRVAILPFKLTDDEDLGLRAHQKVASIRGIFARRFASSSYLSLRLEEVDARLSSAGYERAQIEALPPARLGELLGVDALLIGEIETLSNLEGVLFFHQVIKGSLALVDAKTGQELLRVEHTQRDVGGLLLEFSQSLEAIQHTLDNSSDLGFVRLAEKFAESLATQVPPPPKPLQHAPPRLGEIEIVASREGVLRAGDELEVLARADPGLHGLWIMGRGRRLALEEGPPGVYRGHYDVVVGDYLEQPMTIQVADAFGNGASKVLRENRQRIDARAPIQPSQLAAERRQGALHLSWVASEAEPTVTYRVYGLGSEGVPTLLAKVETTSATVEAHHPRYAVAGVDTHGNLGRLAVVEVASAQGESK